MWPRAPKWTDLPAVWYKGVEYRFDPITPNGADITFVFPDGYKHTLTDTEYTKLFPKKEKTMATLTVEAQTEDNRKVAADAAKYAAKGRKATISVEAITYASPAFASLSGYNDQGESSDQSFYFKLNAADLEALQNAIYEARVKLHKAAAVGAIKNPSLITYASF